MRPPRPARFAGTEAVLGSPTRNLAAILLFVSAVIVLATIAYMAAGWPFADALYMVLLTVYTVGYGEVRPINTPFLHGVTIATMVLGCTGMILLTSAIVQIFTLFQIRQLLSPARMQSRIDKLSDHVIVCGYGRIGVMLARELKSAGVPLVIVERTATRVAEAEAEGHFCLAGDATDESWLRTAGVERARVLATVLPDDAANVFITLSARSLSPRLEIIARGELPSTEGKLRHAGADRVVLPTHIGAERIARMVLYPESAAGADDAQRRLEQMLGEHGLTWERVTVTERSAAAGCTIREAERRGQGGFFVAKLERDGEGSVAHPDPDHRIRPGDRLMIVARDPAAAARTLVAPGDGVRIGRTTF